MNIIFKERAYENLDDINLLYEIAGYNGKASIDDKIFLAKLGEEILGSVKIAKEHGSHVLRGMFMHPEHRGSGIGLNFLKVLPTYLDSLEQPCYAIPHDHLLNFYGAIGFKEIRPDEVPEFLKERFLDYLNRGLKVKLIKRDPNQAYKITLITLPSMISVCRLPAVSQIPAWGLSASFYSVTKTSDEVSIVCDESHVPSDVKREDGFRALKVKGPLDFGLTGILASLAEPLAKAKISIFAISTFDTDYLLIKKDSFENAIKILINAGHHVEDQ